MQYRFRYQPMGVGARAIMDLPARAEVILAFGDDGAVDFDVVRLWLRDIEVPTGTGLHEDAHDFLCRHCAADVRRILADAGKNATAVMNAVGYF